VYHLDVINQMSGTRLRNYILPGLDSVLLEQGKLRLFESSRDTEEFIVPHSHRFDFACLVLEGVVTNKKYVPVSHEEAFADMYTMTTLKYEGQPGSYSPQTSCENKRFRVNTHAYQQGDWYSMSYEEIHSISFRRNTKVLFLEGPERSTKTVILEPFVNGKKVPTFKVEEWMFQI